MECSRCKGPLLKVWFVEKERKVGVETGRVRDAVSHLECSHCGKREVVDDSMDLPWRYPGAKEQKQ